MLKVLIRRRLAEAIGEATGRSVNVVVAEHAGLPLLFEALNHGFFVAGDRQAYTEDRWRVTLEWLDFVDSYERMHRAYRKRLLGA